MANRVSRKQRLYDLVPDWIWPHLQGGTKTPPKDDSCFKIKHSRLLDDVHPIFSSWLAQAEERDRTVESKLAAQLTLTSVLSVAVIASLATATTVGMLKEEAGAFVWVALPLVFYVVAQLLRALWATLSGFTRRSYKRLSPGDMIPEDGETSEAYRTRLRNLQVNNMRWNEWVVDQKVNEMAVANAALKNALIVTFGLVILAVVFAFIHLLEGEPASTPTMRVD